MEGSNKKKSYYSTISETEWDDVSKKMKDVIFHKYFLGEGKGGKYGDRWDDENKFTKRLRSFISKRDFDEYGNIVGKVCGFCCSMIPLERDGEILYRKNKSSRDGLGNRGKCCSSKTNRR